MTNPVSHGIYGFPPEGLVDVPAGAMQFSPLVPDAATLEGCEPGSLQSLTMLAPPGTLERRYALAQGLRALAPGAPFHILAPKDRGGSRLVAELEAFGCDVSSEAKHHHRICAGLRPTTLSHLEKTLEATGPRQVPPFGLWTQPGVFSWDRLDPGTALLMQHLPALSGHGADFGCGIGIIARAVLTAEAVRSLLLVDIDRRAIAAARLNIDDPRATFSWSDLRRPDKALPKLDFVVTNPPFHDAGAEERRLGQVFIERAAAALRRGGRLYLVANRHLPYEAVMKPLFRTVSVMCEASGFKVFEAVL